MSTKKVILQLSSESLTILIQISLDPLFFKGEGEFYLPSLEGRENNK